MKSFCLNAQGDVVLEKGDVGLVYDRELVRQKIKQILSTNKGEWWANPKEGVPVQKILVKNPNIVKVKDYVRSAVRQVDSDLDLANCSVTVSGRILHVDFKIMGLGGVQTIELEV